MAKVIVSQFITVDGVVEDPGGSESHERGGWAFKYDRGPDGDQFKLDEVMASEVLLLGRTTYEGFADAWPSREGEFADKFNNMPKYVVSTTMDSADWNNSTLIKDDVAGEVAKLREQDGGDILVNGSVQLVEDAARERPRGRAAPDGLPGRARRRQAPLRRDRGARLARAGGVAGRRARR